ncbi:MAG: hypothetical protein Q7J29_04085 [Stagnimonas sp.]|nr:hypothetical protein [Stagnimonas sp.]
MHKARLLAGLMLFVLGSAASAVEPTFTDRETAAKAAALGQSCTGLNFYWEIGDANGNFRSGNGPAGTQYSKVKATQSGYIASAGKWLYGAYVLEKTGGVLDQNADKPFLNFTSPYHALRGCYGKTVGACGADNNNPPTPGDLGKFYYESGHMQAHAAQDATGLIGIKTLKAAQLGPVIANTLHIANLKYGGPVLAGDAQLDTVNYASFLRQILNGTLKMKDALGTAAVCASDDEGYGVNLKRYCGVDGLNVALYSPPQRNADLNAGNPDTSPEWPADGERWQYSVGHWVEKDGTFSSGGAFGYYPWIDKSKQWYGILARYEFGNLLAYQKSIVCGRAIRNAWLLATPGAAP